MIDKPTPQSTEVRAGLPAIRRRIGNHGAFKEAMLRGLRSRHRPGLSGLLTSSDEDWTIAFLDSFAGVLDTLSFYNERLINEAYLGTATESFSLQELAALVGYTPTPAVAAEAYMAFIADPTVLETGVAELPAGLGIKSVPEEGELPQTFETVEPLRLKAAWNSIHPVTVWPQSLSRAQAGFYADPSQINLRVGDMVAFQDAGGALLGVTSNLPVLRPVSKIVKQANSLAWIETTAGGAITPVPGLSDIERVEATEADTLSAGSIDALTADLDAKQWPRPEVLEATEALGLAPADLAATLAATPRNGDSLTPVVFREKCKFFGHNYVSRPKIKSDANDDLILYDLPATYQPTVLSAQRYALVDEAMQEAEKPSGVYPNQLFSVFLDRKYDSLVAGSLIVIRGRQSIWSNEAYAYVNTEVVERWSIVESVETVSIEAYGLSGEVTKLRIPVFWGGNAVYNMLIRSAELFIAAEPVPLPDLPLVDPIGGDAILLDRPDFDFAPGQSVFVSGERVDLPGVSASERATIAEVWANGTTLRLTFAVPLTHSYLRPTVTLTGNVARATHGEAKHEILGSGDAKVPFQRFRLKTGPLTYVSAETETGRAAELEVRVDGVRWHEVSALDQAGPNDRVYTVTTREDGSSEVMFGGAGMGAVLPTGENNVEAFFRVGAGAAGRLKAEQLTLLVSKPRSLKGVRNPLAPSGGASFAGMEEIRSNATKGMETLGRIVSLNDYQTFAAAFAGITKAKASWSWVGEDQHVFLTVAGEDEAPLDPEDAVLTNLAAAIAAQSTPGSGATLRPARVARFTLSARLLIDPDYRATGGSADPVLNAARVALRAAYAYGARQIGQPVRASDVITLLQAVAGVLAVDLDALHRTDRAVGLNPILRASVPRSGVQGDLLGAEILLLSADPVALEAI